ncbi:bifunctional [glutamate--ammonia ligase]-adenylyl-L-tyrosine phosphorylase/[glutamate--ammonia-ligase] adenylyltransferase [Congregibacter litoralis]|uniref:Bifunctional glutamine synthetase adenylyltransferase/adenylyl-removing enzyme n=1 Tax=Congregibacter litoralis KT71 TaxID=314285 RepID=A4A8Y8_9GAMM|nr:bifunctional [glutamate--ammonia ligase]-adenylyl-L-tyrosine phosphorylase/[glutamate--ammonia-ligase] adenylyltransferase [Congregibacter litoralis]EAQ97530.1 Glutamine synthetase adenylyltransferase [Congregibacter litoralis KT71]
MNLQDNLPETLREPASRAWAAILEAAGPTEAPALEGLLERSGFAQQLATVLAGSRYVGETLRRRPWLLVQLATAGHLEAPLREGALEAELAELLARSDDDPGVVLRRFRQRHMLRIIWRDLNRLAPTLETTRDVSWLADACISLGLERCMAELEAKYGQPRGQRSGEAQELIVVAMGKLGAHELNLSSDIDLIFTYPESGSTEGARRSVSNEEFFTRVGRALIALLDPVTAEGFVFRVDMRLRPYGESGALVQSFAALEAYYQEQGRDWERYALIKARPVTGSLRHRRELLQCLQPFVYRRYVDYSAIESLRSMKQLIVAEVRRRGLQGNVKLGSGGIREIEFIAQCFQLIRGGRDVSLQRRELCAVLAECASLGCLPESVVQELQVAYLFLRDGEHAIQAWEDRQTQELPTDPIAQAALAHCMGFGDYDAFSEALAGHRDAVARHFAALIAEDENSTPAPESADLWSADCDPQQLADLGFSDAAGHARRLCALFDSRRIQCLQAEGRERLDRFMPLLLEACAESEHPDLALERSLPLVSAVARRSAYLLLLIENPPALADLAALCGASPWIAEQLATRPALLDELLDRASLYTAPEREALQSELRQQTARLTVDDLEGHMDALRYFKASQVLRVAASELSGRLPLMKVSDKLSFIAEVCLEQVLALAWAQLALRYGEPAREGTGSGFVVLAYGKLGGIELSYASDLDLVFIFDAKKGGYTDGDRSIDNATFYMRLGQKMIHILETRMGLGQLYEIDMRLRPSGDSGMLVSTLSAFEQYQRNEAWTWEHQAFVRARPVAGDEVLAQKVEALRRNILCQARDVGTLGEEVVTMREKMRSHAKVRREDAEMDLKQGFGGIVDIEFVVQYAVLAWASQEPSLADWSDNVRILEALADSGYLPKEQCRALIQAYLELRSVTHQLALQQQPPKLPAKQFATERSTVQLVWESLFAEVTAAGTPEADGTDGAGGKAVPTEAETTFRSDHHNKE